MKTTEFNPVNEWNANEYRLPHNADDAWDTVVPRYDDTAVSLPLATDRNQAQPPATSSISQVPA